MSKSIVPRTSGFVGIISDGHFDDLVKRYEKAQKAWVGTKIVRGTGNRFVAEPVSGSSALLRNLNVTYIHRYRAHLARFPVCGRSRPIIDALFVPLPVSTTAEASLARKLNSPRPYGKCEQPGCFSGSMDVRGGGAVKPISTFVVPIHYNRCLSTAGNTMSVALLHQIQEAGCFYQYFLKQL